MRGNPTNTRLHAWLGMITPLGVQDPQRPLLIGKYLRVRRFSKRLTGELTAPWRLFRPASQDDAHSYQRYSRQVG